MKIEDKKTDGCRVKLVITAPAEETRGEYDRIADIYKRRARIRGFRPGKVPLSVIEKFYGKELNADVRAALVRKFLGEAIAREKLDVIARVNVSDALFSTATGVSFAAEVDVRPEFKLPKYQKLPLKTKEIEIADEEIDKQVEACRASVSPYEDCAGPIAGDDKVQIDFTTECPGGRTLADVVPSAARYSGGKNFPVVVSDESVFVPGLNAALTGKKAGERFSLDVSFPADFEVEGLRGQGARYDVTVKAVRRVSPLGDKELLEKLELKDLDQLRKLIRNDLLEQAKAADAASVRDQICTILLRKAAFDLPKSIVGMVLERKLDEVIRTAIRGREDPRAYAEAHAKELEKQALQAAERKLRLDYILEAIAKEQKIEVSEAEVQKEIDGIARFHRMRSGNKNLTAAALREKFENDGTILLLRMDLLSGKVLDWLVDDALAPKDAK